MILHFFFLCVQAGWTALHYASGGGHLTTMKALLKYGADIDARSEVKKQEAIRRLECYDVDLLLSLSLATQIVIYT